MHNVREYVNPEGETRWFYVHWCGNVESGFKTQQGAARVLDRHIAWHHSAPACHHP